MTAIPAAHASAWLRASVATALHAVVREPAARACRHIAPAPYVLTLHDQRLRCVSCACAYAAALRELDPAEDHTCDRCRQQHPILTPVLLDLAALHVTFGLCSTCLDHEGPRDAAR